MIIGDKASFAIECEVESIAKGWIFGHIRFWFEGVACGNWEDVADLKGCYSWLESFAVEQCNRRNDAVIMLSKSDAFKCLFESIYGPSTRIYTVGERDSLATDYSRYDISHLGMSSFDTIHMFFMENSETQRCLWRNAKQEFVHDFQFPVGHMQSVALDFCERFLAENSVAMRAEKQ